MALTATTRIAEGDLRDAPKSGKRGWAAWRLIQPHG
jgi:hypothetical protein